MKNKEKKMPKLSQKKQIEFDVLYKSQIGKEINIIESPNKLQTHLKGILMYESANLFYIKTTEGLKKITKSNIKFQTKYNNQNINIDGNLFVGTLTQRIKKIK